MNTATEIESNNPINGFIVGTSGVTKSNRMQHELWITNEDTRFPLSLRNSFHNFSGVERFAWVPRRCTVHRWRECVGACIKNEGILRTEKQKRKQSPENSSNKKKQIGWKRILGNCYTILSWNRFWIGVCTFSRQFCEQPKRIQLPSFRR